ncbi:MAG: hypothetical protein FRX48_01899 [Lasallia pustulata]|uniref:Extracellular mutant protein 11 C-terminal domain-containing protein n=1 Tax=Lasallia pustulata TaxID=136370 RepID=A0A5M8Q2H1_9LECA|nr:MAG: hypothetical protein FRX48_01899 [Lasallia pustulata]
MAGLSSYVNRGPEPQPASLKSRRQQVADIVRMPTSASKQSHETATPPTAPGDGGGLGKAVKPPNTQLDVKREQSQSQQKYSSAFDTDVEDIDSTTTLALDEHLKSLDEHLQSSPPRTQSHEYAHPALREYNGSNVGNDYRGAADNGIQPRTATTEADQQHSGQGAPIVGEEEEGEEEEGEGEDEDGGESGDESGSEGGSQDGNQTIDLTNMNIAERASSANDDEFASLYQKVLRNGSRKRVLPLNPAPFGGRQNLPVRNGGNEMHAQAGAYRPENLEDGYAKSSSFLPENLAPQRTSSRGITGQKMRRPIQKRDSQPLLNDSELLQQRGPWDAATGNKGQRSQPQVLQREPFPSLAGSKLILRNVDGPTTTSYTQLEQLEDLTMSSNFDASELGENRHIPTHPAEHFANHATNPQEDFRGPASKRPFQLDYDDVQLSEMTFEELRKQPFDHDPQALPSTLPNDISNASLAEKLKHITSTLQTDTERAEKRQRFFSSLTMDEHEECGDMIVEEFSHVIKKLKDARRDKRKLAMAYEEEVAIREERIRAKRELLEKDMHRLKRAGQDVISGKQA